MVFEKENLILKIETDRYQLMTKTCMTLGLRE
jgi:hypothetical protein